MHHGELLIRLATDADRAAVLAFCRAGDPGDYVPYVWDDWLAEPGSAMLVGVLPPARQSREPAVERPAAMAHVVVREGEAWFEGLRIAPELRGRGFGQQMLARSALEARERGARVLRLLTANKNAAMQAILPRLSFEQVFEAQWYVAPALDGPPPQTFDGPVEALLPLLDSAPLLRDTGGLYAPGWSFWTPGRAALADHLARGEVAGVPGVDGWAIVMDDGEDDGQMAVALAAGDVAQLLPSLRAHPAIRAGGELSVLVPGGGDMERLLQLAGFRSRSARRFGVFALSL